jgi:hypothetical protein
MKKLITRRSISQKEKQWIAGANYQGKKARAQAGQGKSQV